MTGQSPILGQLIPGLVSCVNSGSHSYLDLNNLYPQAKWQTRRNVSHFQEPYIFLQHLSVFCLSVILYWWKREKYDLAGKKFRFAKKGFSQPGSPSIFLLIRGKVWYYLSIDKWLTSLSLDRAGAQIYESKFGLFKISEPWDQEIGEFYVVQKCLRTILNLQKIVKGSVELSFPHVPSIRRVSLSLDARAFFKEIRNFSLVCYAIPYQPL